MWYGASLEGPARKWGRIRVLQNKIVWLTETFIEKPVPTFTFESNLHVTILLRDLRFYINMLRTFIVNIKHPGCSGTFWREILRDLNHWFETALTSPQTEENLQGIYIYIDVPYSIPQIKSTDMFSRIQSLYRLFSCHQHFTITLSNLLVQVKEINFKIYFSLQRKFYFTRDWCLENHDFKV